MEKNIYDIAIVGGGLAGLSLAIQSAQLGFSTILFEKEQYPFHRVCGEYISLESWNFLEQLGLPLQDMQLPIIKQLIVSAPNGKHIQHTLPLGGFGISRHTIDYKLFQIAVERGVVVKENTKVNNVLFENNLFTIHFSEKNIKAKIVCGSFGKRSNLDIKWNRSFIQNKPNKLNNYLGIKYHIHTPHAKDVIALHNFKNGYCGISAIEDGKYCLCYLTNAQNLQANNNSIKKMEENVLMKNPFLKKIFSTADFLFNEPVIISQISFERKSLVENHILLMGDAAGMITPLCGNGMSMALHSSKIAFSCIKKFLEKKIAREEMEYLYTQQWNKKFSRRLSTGRLIQQFFGHPQLTNIFVQSIKPFPSLINTIIKQTHGYPF